MKEAKEELLLNKVKSNYILKRIFGNVTRTKFFNVIRYNKKIQKKLEKDLEDYRKEHLKIELEIVPGGNNFAYFISYIKDTNESYYHIYINDNKEELKRNYYIKNDKAKKIKVVLEFPLNTSLSGLFKNCNDINCQFLFLIKI